jgi:hypothetical protein
MFVDFFVPFTLQRIKIKMLDARGRCVITNFCDFAQFSAKKWRFSKKAMS